MKKRLLSILLASVLVVSTCVPVMAAEEEVLEVIEEEAYQEEVIGEDYAEDDFDVVENVEAVEEVVVDTIEDSAEVEDESDTTEEENVEGVVLSGYCGDNAAFELTGDKASGYVLTVTGFGKAYFLSNANGMTTDLWKYKDNIVKVILPQGITGIYNLDRLPRVQQITIPNSVITIHNCFSECTALKSISISDNATDCIANFKGCTALESVRLPQNINEMFFQNCTSLKSIQVGNNIVLANGNLNLPEGITRVGSYAFSGCPAINNVTLPSTTKEIAIYAFMNCTNLKTVVIGNVSNCWIKSYVFSECSNLTDVTIPKGVVSIDSNGVFSKCPKVKIHCYKGSAAYDYVVENGFLYNIIPEYNYSITFNANGGKGKMKGISKCISTNPVKLTANKFKKDGYHFAGWNTNKKGKGIAVANGATVSNLATKNGQKVVLYAQWAKNTYTIKFNSNGGKGSMKNMSMTYGKAKKLSKNSFTKKGYKFAGWATSKKNAKKGKVAYANKKKINNLSKKNGATVTLYAVWKKK